MLEPLRGLAPDARLIATRSRSERAMAPDRIVAAARAAGFAAVEAADVPLACAMALAEDAQRPALLTGSLFAVGEAMEAYGGAPGEWL